MQTFYCIGNLTKDTEYFETANGSQVCKFCVAVNRPHNRQETDYFNVVTWNALAQSCSKYLKKGSKVAVIGNIQNRYFEDSNGNKKSISEVIAQEVEFLSQYSYDKTNDYAKKETQQQLEQQFLPF